MTRISILLASAAIAFGSAVPALADCAADIAAMRTNDLTATGSTGADGSKTTNFDASGGSASTPKRGPIVQDGSHAPLEPADGATKTAAAKTAAAKPAMPTAGGTTTTPGQTATGGKVVQDGTTAPLASGAGGADPQVATSAQDAASQQAGNPPAAVGASTEAALAKAQKAADAGDENACQQALRAISG